MFLLSLIKYKWIQNISMLSAWFFSWKEADDIKIFLCSWKSSQSSCADQFFSLKLLKAEPELDNDFFLYVSVQSLH